MALLRRNSLLLLVLPRIFKSCAAAPPSPPNWQTVFPDTKIVVPLFGKEGPRWRLDYQDLISSQNNVETRRSIAVPGNLTARVPGDVVSDLMHNGLIKDPYVELNLWEEQEAWLGPQGNQDDHRVDAHSTESEPPKLCRKQQTRIWTYSTEIELPNENYTWQLVVESLQMGASIFWNDVFVANVTDQFLRYTLPLPIGDNHFLKTATAGRRTQHSLKITFDPSIETDGRFMACAGGWDWAPYTYACDAQGRRIFTRGIVKPIYLVAIDQFAITHVVPKIYYQGPLPRAPLKQPDADFLVKLEVHLEIPSGQEASSATKRYQIVAVSDFGKENQTVSVGLLDASTVMTFNMIASKEEIKLWWPNGMGPQPLYEVHVGIQEVPPSINDSSAADRGKGDNPSSSSAIKRLLNEGVADITWIVKRVGFRTSAIVTTNETGPMDSDVNDQMLLDNQEADEEEGTGLHGMYVKINGAMVMARGANIIPNDQLEGRFATNVKGNSLGSNDIAYKRIVQSAAAANMNMIRVWGGGKILPQSFHDACDRYGILVYQDQMFAQGDHGPVSTSTLRQEIQHTIRSLASHASIVVWNGCNECQVIMGTESEIYATFVLQTAAQEDDTRSVWPSSPSHYGWEKGVRRADSKPIAGKLLATRNPDDHKNDAPIETHGPYMRAFSDEYPQVNGVNQHFPYPKGPTKLSLEDIGPQYPNTFASEFGCDVWSSFESISGTITDKTQWGLHGGRNPDTCNPMENFERVCEGDNVMAQRNYPCGQHINAYFGNWTALDDVGEDALKAQLYQCMTAQALWMKANIEYRRSTNSFGL